MVENNVLILLILHRILPNPPSFIYLVSSICGMWCMDSRIVPSFSNDLVHYPQDALVFIAGNFAQLCEFISHSYEVLSRNAGHLDNVLGTFDIQQHSLGVLGIL